MRLTKEVNVLTKDDEVPAVHLDEGRGRSAAAQGLESDRARPREEIEELRAADLALDDVEDAFANPVLRRTDRVRVRHLQNPPAKLSAGNPHESKE